MSLPRVTHAEADAERLAQWAAMTPNERVALAVELSRRVKQLASDNGDIAEEVSSITTARRR